MNNNEISLLEKQKELVKEYTYLKKEDEQLETIINVQSRREEINKKKSEIEENLLEINIRLLKQEI
jgi:hypothetical protein